MKRRALESHLKHHGCELLREGGRHSVFWNPVNRKVIIPSQQVRLD